MTTSGEDDRFSFTSQTSGSVYSSALIKVTAAQTGDYFFTLYSAANGYMCKLYIKTDGAGGYYFGIAKTSASAVTYETTSRTFSQTYLVVMKYKFNSSTADDEVSLYVNPAIGSVEPTATLGPTTSSGASDAAKAVPDLLLHLLLTE